jgi:CRP-like cAMP-binding protein
MGTIEDLSGGACRPYGDVGVVSGASHPPNVADHRADLMDNAPSGGLAVFKHLVADGTVIPRGGIIVGSAPSNTHFTVLLEGLACRSVRQGGIRHIHTFYHSGDFLALHGILNSASAEHGEVEALSNCSVGRIDPEQLEQELSRHPALATALWQVAMIEAATLRWRSAMARWPPRQRVAYVLCEQLAHLPPSTTVVPLSQVEIGDAVGLPAIQVNRLLQDLRELGTLSDQPDIEVADRARLLELAAMDGRYVDRGKWLSGCDVMID